ncbi:MAG: YicC/YloC family endoribonuclease [Oceanipulchritudo sp.]
MTGFGRSQATVDGIGLSVEVNAVNRRNLEIAVSLPREWQPLEKEIQDLIRQRVHRGKLHVYVQADPGFEEGGFHWDEDGLQSSLKRLAVIATREGFDWPPSADALVRLAALNKIEGRLPSLETIEAPLLRHLTLAMEQLMEMREMEGRALGEDLDARLQALVAHMTGIRSLSGDTVCRYRELLLQRLNQAGLELELSDERVLKEIALFADRCDISEEITRLESHFRQLNECLHEGSPVGRKLEFILQEVNREFNTVGSKANNIEVNRLVIEAKNEIERIREQLQNIE